MFCSIKKKVKGGQATPTGGSGNNCKTLPNQPNLPAGGPPSSMAPGGGQSLGKFSKEPIGEPISSAIVKYNYQAQQLGNKTNKEFGKHLAL